MKIMNLWTLLPSLQVFEAAGLAPKFRMLMVVSRSDAVHASLFFKTYMFLATQSDDS